jgi:hypothetical protein
VKETKKKTKSNQTKPKGTWNQNKRIEQQPSCILQATTAAAI